MFSNLIVLVASALGHILNVYSRAWYKRDGISWELVKLAPALLVDYVMLQQIHVLPGFVMKAALLNEWMIVARFAVDATKFGLKSLDVLLMLPLPCVAEEDYSSVNDLFGMNDAYAAVFVVAKSWLQQILHALQNHQQCCL